MAELVVDVATHAQREVDALGFETGDLAAQDVRRRRVIPARRPEELLVAVVAAEHGVREVEEDDRSLCEVGESLVLDAAPGGDVAGGRGRDDRVGQDRALGRQSRP